MPGSYLREPARRTPVIADCDVVVVGGGVAGVSAAVAAAREGASVVLIERTNALGGLATIGLVLFYLPLCDGRGRQVIAGIGEELLKLSIRYGPGDIPEAWAKKDASSVEARTKTRYYLPFGPASFVLALDEFVVGAKVALRLETSVVEPILKRRRVAGVFIQDKSGRRAIRAKVVVDASGDADVAADADAPVRIEKNFLSLWLLHTSLDAVREAVSTGDLAKAVPLMYCGPDPSRPEKSPRKYSGSDAESVTAYNLESRRAALREIVKRQEAAGGRKAVFPVTLPTMAQFRTTRCIVGEYVLDIPDDGRAFPDSVGMTGDWRKAGPCYSLPYRTLLPQRVDGLLTAGRVISTTTEAWEVTRVIPTCAVTGEAAGRAAALCARTGRSPRDLPVAKLQERLRAAGVLLP